MVDADDAHDRDGSGAGLPIDDDLQAGGQGGKVQRDETRLDVHVRRVGEPLAVHRPSIDAVEDVGLEVTHTGNGGLSRGSSRAVHEGMHVRVVVQDCPPGECACGECSLLGVERSR